MFGLLGRNGAGKTTLMKVLATLLPKTEGSVSVCGIPVEDAARVRRITGYLPQEFSMYPNMTVYEAMDYLGVLSGLGSRKRRELIPKLLSQVNLLEDQKKKVAPAISVGSAYLTAGTHKMSFMITYGCNIYLNKVDFTPVELKAADADKLSLTAATLSPVDKGKTGDALIQAVLDAKPLALMGVPITAVSENQDIATAEIVMDPATGEAKLRVTGVAGGTTSVKVEMTLGEVKKSVNVPVSINNVADAITLDFAKCKADGHVTDPNHAKLADHGWEVVPDETKPFYCEFSMSDLGMYGYCPWMSETEVAKRYWVTMNFDVAMDGFYKISAITAQNQDTGKIETLIDGKPIKTMATTISKQTEYTLSDEEALGYTFLTKGTHKIRFTLIYSSKMYLNKLVFMPIELAKGQTTISATETDAINVGENTGSTITAKIGEVPVALSASDIEVVAGDPDIATAELDTSAGNLSVNVTGISGGNTEILVRVKLGNITETVNIPVTVNASGDGPQPFALDFAACHRKGHDTSVTHATLENHNWSFNAKESSATTQFQYFVMTQGGLHAHSNTWWSTPADSRTTAINFKVPKDGTYACLLYTSRCV